MSARPRVPKAVEPSWLGYHEWSPFVRTFSLAWVLIGMVSLMPAGARRHARGGPEYVLVPKSAKRVKAGLTLEVMAPKVKADEWCVFTPQTPSCRVRPTS